MTIIFLHKYVDIHFPNNPLHLRSYFKVIQKIMNECIKVSKEISECKTEKTRFELAFSFWH